MASHSALKRERLSPRARRGAALVLLVISVWAGHPRPSLGQEPASPWSPPSNLSQSGSASQPAIVLGQQGTAQAFWWDRFDGLMTAYMDGTSWQPAANAGLMVPDPRPTTAADAEAEPTPLPIAVMPQLIGDSQGTVHAFWLVERGGFAAAEPDPVPADPSVAHATMRVGDTSWSESRLVAEGVLLWQAFADPAGGMHLAYIRSQHTSEEPAGLYYARLGEDGLQWEAPRLVQPSIYARLLDTDRAHLAGVANGAGAIILAWRDPRLGQATYLCSDDGGETWNATTAPLEHATEPRLAYLGTGRTLAIWQVGLSDTQVSYYQQVSDDAGRTWTEPTWVPREAARYGTPATRQAGWEGDVWLVSGEGGPYLSLARWREIPDAATGEWSLANTVAVNVQDAEIERTISLEELQIAASDHWLTLIGLGQDGEVWAMHRETGAIAWAFSSDTPWTDPTAMWEGDTGATLPAMVADLSGKVHTWWIAPSDTSRSGVALWYAQREGDGWATATAVLALEEQAEHPVAAVTEGRIHLLWTVGRIGALSHSSVFQDRAVTASEWSTVRRLPLPAGAGGASAPSLLADGQGGLHAIYAVPLNESRGIYYVRSADGGASWSAPSPVVNAADAGWPSVDAPHLAIGADGTLYATWVRVPLASGIGEGVYLAQSNDGGATWSAPLTVTEGPCSNPQLALSGAGSVHVFWVDEAVPRVWSCRHSIDGGAIWSLVESVPGMSDLRGSPDLAADGSGPVHLMAISVEQAGEWLVRHATWDPSTAAWAEVGGFRVGALYQLRGGVSLALLPEQGWLHALLPAESTEADDEPVLLHAYRALAPTEGQPGLVSPLPGAADIVEQPETAVAPPTVWLDTEPAPTAGAGISLGPFYLPMTGIVGIGIAALAVLAVAFWHGARSSGLRRSRPWTRSR